MHVYMTAVGLTAIPGMAIVQASSLLNYIIGWSSPSASPLSSPAAEIQNGR
jgi:hypothetical protein